MKNAKCKLQNLKCKLQIGLLVVGMLVAGMQRGVSGQRRRGRRPARKRANKGLVKKKVRIPRQSPQQQAAEEQRRQQRRQWSRDVVYWKKVLAGKPTAEQTEQALFHLGTGYEWLGRHTEAISMFRRLLKEFPSGPWRGEALVHLVDLHLQGVPDVSAAVNRAEESLEWLLEQQKSAKREAAPVKQAGEKNQPKRRTASRPALPPPRRGKPSTKNNRQPLRKSPAVVLQPAALAVTAREIYLRMAAIRFAQQQEQAAELFYQKSGGLRTLAAGSVTALAVGMQRLFVQIRSHRGQVPSAVRQGDATAAFVLILADVAYAGRDYDRAEFLSAAVLLQTKFSPTPIQRSYALYRRGRSRYAHPDRKLKHKARADYLAAVKAASDAPWAAEALFLAANVSSNIDRNREAAIRGWRQVMRDYPESFEAERSGYYIGISYELSKRYKKAQAAYEDFEQRYPKSSFGELVQKHRRKVEAELRREGG